MGKVVGGFSGAIQDASPALSMTMAAFAGVAIYNSVELLYLIFASFKRRSGLYFWSLSLSTLGIPAYVLGMTLKYFGVAKSILEIEICMVFVIVGWCMMVTGQSVVLYSRLHLVVHNRKLLRWILGMIIADAFICHVPIAVLSLASNSVREDPNHPSESVWVKPYALYTNVQITIFFTQEVIISALYVYSTANVLRRASGVLYNAKEYRAGTTRKVLAHLIVMNLVIIAMDIALLVIQYTNNFALHTIFKGMVYSVKLKMEFRILNQLIELTHNSHSASGTSGPKGLNHTFPLKMRSQHGTTNGTMAGAPTDEENFEFGNNAFVGTGGGEGGSVMLGKDQIMVVEETRVQRMDMERDSGSKLDTRTTSEVDISAKSRSLRRSSGESSDVEFAGRGY
jgi:hypothetical protein